jgi:hypothetical protein
MKKNNIFAKAIQIVREFFTSIRKFWNGLHRFDDSGDKFNGIRSNGREKGSGGSGGLQ